MHDALRIIDANFNRSREGLRVMEEYARFCLADATLTEKCKTLRHDLGNVMCGLLLKLEVEGVVLPNPLVAARDTVGDVGTGISNDSEFDRRDEAHVATAAAKRLTEALRAIEEYCKIIDSAVARRIEQLRYRAYEVERSLTLIASARKRFAGVRLYVLITEALCKGNWFDTARTVVENGADCLQLREKNLSDAELLDRATRLAKLCRETGKIFIMNDRADIALASGAHGVHLGQDDIGTRQARRVLPVGSIIGRSTHTIGQVDAAIADTSDYIAVGPMFATDTKPDARVAGVETLISARERTALPLVAIGGLTADRSAETLAHAPCCVCACTAIISQTDIASATRTFREAIDKAWQLRQDG